MPELPEVETIKLQLQKEIKNKIISGIEIIDYPQADKEIKEKALSKIKEIRRRAKLLIIDLENNYSLLIHLKLTGYFIFYPKEIKEKSGLHLVFRFKNKGVLAFYDQRKFGFVKLVRTNQLDEFLKKEYNFGPEPLASDFTLEKFKEILKKKPQSPIKSALMEQDLIAGLGNVYSQEACFYAKVLPTRKIKTLSEEEIKKLYQGIRKILTEAIKHQGSSVDTYVNIYGQVGGFVPLLKVYQKEKCFKCGNKLKRIMMNGRGTWFCEKCQV